MRTTRATFDAVDVLKKWIAIGAPYAITMGELIQAAAVSGRGSGALHPCYFLRYFTTASVRLRTCSLRWMWQRFESEAWQGLSETQA